MYLSDLIMNANIYISLSFSLPPSLPPSPSRGATDFGDTPDMQMEVKKLKEKRDKLVDWEYELDEQCGKIRQCLCNIIEDPSNSKYPLITTTIL